MADFKYEVTEKHGVLSQTSKGWTKEFRSISWNERESKYDIREWSPEGDKMGKGVTLSKEEVIALKDILNNIEL